MTIPTIVWLKLEMMLLLYGVVGIHYPICSTWAVLPVSFCCTSSETELPTVSFIEICNALMRLGSKKNWVFSNEILGHGDIETNFLETICT